MVTPSTEEEVEEEVEVEEDEIGFMKDPIERSGGGLGIGFSNGNGIEVHQVQTERTLQDRQEEEWSIPTNVGRRENDTERHKSPRAPPPPAPPSYRG